MGGKARHFKEWGSEIGAYKHQNILYSLNFGTCDQTPVMMRLGENDSKGPVSAFGQGSHLRTAGVGELWWRELQSESP